MLLLDPLFEGVPSLCYYELPMEINILFDEGLEGYLGVNNTVADHFQSPGIVLEIRKAKADIGTSDTAGIGYSGPVNPDAERARFFGEGGHPFDLSRQSQNYMFAASKAHAVYKRPDGTLQRGNMFNPYWQPRLVKYSKYLPPEKLILFFMRTVRKLES